MTYNRKERTPPVAFGENPRQPLVNRLVNLDNRVR